MLASEALGFNDDSDYSISSIMQSLSALYKDSFNSWAGVCGSSVASGSFLCIGWRR